MSREQLTGRAAESVETTTDPKSAEDIQGLPPRIYREVMAIKHGPGDAEALADLMDAFGGVFAQRIAALAARTRHLGNSLVQDAIRISQTRDSAGPQQGHARGDMTASEKEEFRASNASSDAAKDDDLRGLEGGQQDGISVEVRTKLTALQPGDAVGLKNLLVAHPEMSDGILMAARQHLGVSTVAKAVELKQHPPEHDQAWVKAAETFNDRHAALVGEFNELTDDNCRLDGARQIDVVAVSHWQKHHGLDADGKVGPATIARAREVKTTKSAPDATADPQAASARVVQRRGDTGEAGAGSVHAAASRGVLTPSSPLPHADTIQRSFGRHDVSAIQAHTGAEAATSARAMGAQAYATGTHVVLGSGTDLHTVAHEAAHVVQQRGGVQFKDGVGAAGDAHERHADDVADAVVAGRSAEGLLDKMAPGSPDNASRAGVVQRKNLTQYGLSGGLAETGTEAIVNRAKMGKVYSHVVAEAVADRTEAMTKASEVAAEIGNRTVGKSWTPDTATFDDQNVDTLDPFLFKVTVPFGEKDKLTLMYQHADRWTGYVVSIEDTSNPATQTGVTMFNLYDGKKRSSDTYSNVHDQDQTMSTNIAKDTEGTQERNLDAYTKISGEGARWQCVRAHAANLRNDSLFFTTNPDTGKILAVNFVDLWLSWVAAFTARYDIPDSDVIKAMKGEITGKGKGRRPGGAPLVGFSRLVDKKDLQAKDYDLDAHQGYQVR